MLPWTALAQPEPSQGLVLIVDDHPYSRILLSDLLELAGYQTHHAEDGWRALQAVEEIKPDLILLDVMMPGLDGYEVCRRLKARPETRLIPIIMVTAKTDHPSQLAAIESGADDFLRRPIDELVLMARVRSLIQQKRLNEDLDHSAQVLFSIARAVEKRDPNTGDHCERLVAIGSDFGTFLELPRDLIKALGWGGYLHDIGKIGIPDAILGKPGPFNAAEWAIMQSHVLIGEEICKPLRSMQAVLPLIRHHHERWDGSGYPDGLAGENIPLIARVFQLVDIYDALTSERPYKQALSPQQALEVMQQETNQGWRDPQLFARFRDFINQHRDPRFRD
ncbi:MAG: response regulator [Thermostichales cyanobacterium BF4_bins_65]